MGWAVKVGEHVLGRVHDAVAGATSSDQEVAG